MVGEDIRNSVQNAKEKRVRMEEDNFNSFKTNTQKWDEFRVRRNKIVKAYVKVRNNQKLATRLAKRIKLIHYLLTCKRVFRERKAGTLITMHMKIHYAGIKTLKRAKNMDDIFIGHSKNAFNFGG